MADKEITDEIEDAAETGSPAADAPGDRFGELPGDPDPAEAKPELKIVDKRRFARILGFGSKDSEADAAEERRQVSAYDTQIEQLRARATQVEADARAEIEAARARLERHFETRLQTAKADIVRGFLGVFDNFERALAVEGAEKSPIYEGLVATRDQFLRHLAELGAEPVASLGEPFDPELHEAVEQVPVDDAAADGVVVGELHRGFRMGERLIRPAAVRVGRAEKAAGG